MAAVGAPETDAQVTAFTPEQAKLVNESWALVQKDDSGKWAVAFFLKIFEIAPGAVDMFSFLKDSRVRLEENPKLKQHALTVFMLTGQAATQLGEKGGLDKLVPTLVKLGDSHVTHGVVDAHFDVVKTALLATLGEALAAHWTTDTEVAWSTAYDTLVNEMKAEMKLVRTRQAQLS